MRVKSISALFLVAVSACVTSAPQALQPALTKIPMAKFVSCYEDKGVQYQNNTIEERAKEVYDDVRQYGQHCGSSNAFLVVGSDFQQAMLDTHRVLFGCQPCSPASASRRSKDHYWLFVSLGTGLHLDPDDRVGPLVFDGRTRTLSFEHPKPGDGAGNRSVRGYVYWVPLGQLGDGEYTLQIFCRGRSRPTFTREVAVRNDTKPFDE